MKLSYRVYIVLLVVFIVSFISAITLQTTGIIKGLYSVPIIASLLGAIYQIVRDSANFDRNLFLQQDQHIFELGATSHMANIAFDKHVSFCEEYITEVHDTVGTLFSEGVSMVASEHVVKLSSIKRQYSAWIPYKILQELDPFESAVSKIANNKKLIKALDNTDRETRSAAIIESYDIIKKVLDIDPLDESEEKQQIAARNVIEKIRSILHIDELIEIRQFIMRKSSEFIQNNT